MKDRCSRSPSKKTVIKHGLSFNFFCAVVILAAELSLGGCKNKEFIENPADSTYFGSLKNVISADYNLSIFDGYLHQAAFADSLGNPSKEFTILLYLNQSAPYYQAPVSKEELNTYTLYHIIRGAFSIQSLPIRSNQPFTTALSNQLFISRYIVGPDTLTTVNGIALSKQLDIRASNGYLNFFLSDDNVPLDPTTGAQRTQVNFISLKEAVQGIQGFSFLSAILQRINVDSILAGTGPYTFFAPTNAALTDTSFHYLHLASLDSIEKADTTKLIKLVKEHIFRGRYFISDLTINRAAKSVIPFVATSGDTVKTYLSAPNAYNGAGNGPYTAFILWGPGNSVDVKKILNLNLPNIKTQGRGFINFQAGVSAGNGVLFAVDKMVTPK